MKIIKKFLILIVILFFCNQGYTLEITNNELTVGSNAPLFELSGYKKDSNIKSKWGLNDFRGLWKIIYFYPKDFSEGCTIEAKGFESIAKEVNSRNGVIIGISNDTNKDHESFCSKEKLNLLLLSDHEGIVSKSYKSWSPPYSQRNTFLIDPEGVIRYKWTNPNPSKHAKDVLKVLESKAGN